MFGLWLLLGICGIWYALGKGQLLLTFLLNVRMPWLDFRWEFIFISFFSFLKVKDQPAMTVSKRPEMKHWKDSTTTSCAPARSRMFQAHLITSAYAHQLSVFPLTSAWMALGEYNRLTFVQCRKWKRNFNTWNPQWKSDLGRVTLGISFSQLIASIPTQPTFVSSWTQGSFVTRLRVFLAFHFWAAQHLHQQRSKELLWHFGLQSARELSRTPADPPRLRNREVDGVLVAMCELQIKNVILFFRNYGAGCFACDFYWEHMKQSKFRTYPCVKLS